MTRSSQVLFCTVFPVRTDTNLSDLVYLAKSTSTECRFYCLKGMCIKHLKIYLLREGCNIELIWCIPVSLYFAQFSKMTGGQRHKLNSWFWMGQIENFYWELKLGHSSWELCRKDLTGRQGIGGSYKQYVGFRMTEREITKKQKAKVHLGSRFWIYIEVPIGWYTTMWWLMNYDTQKYLQDITKC